MIHPTKQPIREGIPAVAISDNPTLSRLSLDQWQSFVDSRPDSMIFHHRCWIELLVEQYGFGLHIYGIERDGCIQVAMPFLETTDLWGSRKLISLPFSDYMHVLDSPEQDSVLLCRLLRKSLGERFKAIVIRSDAPLPGIASFSPHMRHELSTEGGMEAIYNSFDRAVKCNLRRASEYQLQLEQRSDLAAMETFYELQVLTRRKLGIPVQPRSFFQRFHSRLIRNGLGFVGIVSNHQGPIAAGVFLTFNSRLMFKYAASHPQALRLRPNDYLVFSAIKIAAEQGFRCFDFGTSARNHRGLCRFKRKWGTTENEVHHNYITGSAATSLQASPAERLASIAIRHGPAVICRGLGELFYKYSQ